MLAQRGITPAGFVVTTRRRSRRGGYYGTSPAEWEPERAVPSRRAPRAAPPTVRP
jgi:hypothetical protein